MATTMKRDPMEHDEHDLSETEAIHLHAEMIVHNIRVLIGSFAEEYTSLRMKIARCSETEQFIDKMPNASQAMQSITSFAQRLADVIAQAAIELDYGGE